MDSRETPPTDHEIRHILNVATAAAWRAGATAHEIDEVAQKTVVKLWTSWHAPHIKHVRERLPSKWNAYIRRTAKHVHFDLIRSHQRRIQRQERASNRRPRLTPTRPSTVHSPSSVSGVEQHLARRMILDELAILPGKQRVVAWFILAQEKTPREVGEILGIQPQAVRKHLRAAKATLAQRIGGAQREPLEPSG